MELQLYDNYCLKKNGETLLHRQQVDILGQKLEEKREILIEASIEKKELELFKERKILAQREEVAKKEQAVIDEIAVQKRRGTNK